MPKSKSKSGKRKGCKRKLSAEQKRQKQLNRELYETVFINGKQKRVRRVPTIEGLPVDEFIARNADPVWLMQNGYYELLHEHECERGRQQPAPAESAPEPSDDDDELPF
jgi:16S rRNA U516 pseudouridylate synthase RsuA-like enzyme